MEMVRNKNYAENVTLAKEAFEDQNRKIMSVDVPNASPNSELSPNQKLFVKDTPLQQVQPFFSSTRSPKKGFLFDKNSHTQNVSSTQNPQFFNGSTYSRNTHQEVSVRPHISYDPYMGPRFREMRARLEKYEGFNKEFPPFYKVNSIYSLKQNQSTSRNRPINFVKALNESPNPLLYNYFGRSNKQEDTRSNMVGTKRLKNGSMQVKYECKKNVILEVDQDVKRLTCIFPPYNPWEPQIIDIIDVPDANPNVETEPVNPTNNDQPTFSPFEIRGSLFAQTNSVHELEACCNSTKRRPSFKEKHLTPPRSNDTGTSYFEPHSRETPRICRTRLFHTNSSNNTESSASVFEKEKSRKVEEEYSDNSTLEKDSSEIAVNVTKQACIDTQCTTLEKPLNQENLVETTCKDSSPAHSIEQETSDSSTELLDTGVKDMVPYGNNSIKDCDIVHELKNEDKDDSDIVKKDLKENNADGLCLTLGTELSRVDLQETPDKDQVVFVQEEPFTIPISYCDDLEAREFVPPKSTSAYEGTLFKADLSQNINILSQSISPVFEKKISIADSGKSLEVKVNSGIAKKALDNKCFNPLNSTFDTHLNQKDLAEKNSHGTSQLLSVELEPILSSKDAGTGDSISCASSFGETTPFNIYSSENTFKITKPMNDLKYSDNSILVIEDSDVQRIKKKSIDEDTLCSTLGTNLNQEFNFSSINPISNILFKKENSECSDQIDKDDMLLKDYPNVNKMEIEYKPNVTPKKKTKYKKEFTKESIKSSPIELKAISTSVVQEHKTLIKESQLGELEQKIMNSHGKSNDHNETILKTCNTSSTLIMAPVEKEVISSNLSTPNKSLNFEMIDFTQMDDDSLYPAFSMPLNQESEKLPVALCSNKLIEENIELNKQSKFDTILQKNENISSNTPCTFTQKEQCGSPIKASHQEILMQSIPLTSDIVESERVSSFCVPSSIFAKESLTSSLNGMEISTNLNSQPEITCTDTNVIFTKCNIVEIEVKTSPKSEKVKQTRSKNTVLENSLETNTKKSKMPSTFDCCIIDDSSRCSEENLDEKLPLVMTEEYPENEMKVSDSEDVSKKFISSNLKKITTQNIKKRRRKSRLTMTKRRRKLSVAKELSYSSGIEAIFEDLENVKFTYQNFDKNVHNLVMALISPEHSLDTVQLIFHVIQYLYSSCKNPMINPDDQSYAFCNYTSNFLPITEDCIISTLFKIDERRKPEFQNLVNSTVLTLYNIVLGKEFEFPLNRLVSLCRVLTKICKRKNNKIKPLQLCGELIKWQHQYAPYLIASVSSIWQELFQLSSSSDKEENIFFGAIARGVKTKPQKMSDSEWQQCQAVFSKVLLVKPTEDKQIPREVCTLFQIIGSKCLKPINDKNFLLTTPLVIYTQIRGWEWTRDFLVEPLIVPSLKKYSCEIPNEIAFEFMINLYAEIRFHCPDKEDPYGLLTFYFETGTNYLHFMAAIALLKLIMWKGDYFSEEILQWLSKWSEHNKVTAIQPLFQRRMMKHKNFSTADIIEEQLA